jgi:hypothetical protein
MVLIAHPTDSSTHVSLCPFLSQHYSTALPTATCYAMRYELLRLDGKNSWDAKGGLPLGSTGTSRAHAQLGYRARLLECKVRTGCTRFAPCAASPNWRDNGLVFRTIGNDGNCPERRQPALQAPAEMRRASRYSLARPPAHVRHPASRAPRSPETGSASSGARQQSPRDRTSSSPTAFATCATLDDARDRDAPFPVRLMVGGFQNQNTRYSGLT